MKVLGIIPARYASTRFPGKPLADIGGKPMIQRVYEQANKCKLFTEIVVATDDNRIKTVVEHFGGKAMLTSKSHNSGTDRCAEVVKKIGRPFNCIINIQGDEPFIRPQQIATLIRLFENKNVGIATLVKKINSPAELNDASEAKVVLGKSGRALYFSRSVIPFVRNYDASQWLSHSTFYKHIGIYGYRPEVLKQIVKLPFSPLEKAEHLEQLRWLENGYTITTAETKFESYSIDTPEDVKRVMKLMRK